MVKYCNRPFVRDCVHFYDDSSWNLLRHVNDVLQEAIEVIRFTNGFAVFTTYYYLPGKIRIVFENEKKKSTYYLLLYTRSLLLSNNNNLKHIIFTII